MRPIHSAERAITHCARNLQRTTSSSPALLGSRNRPIQQAGLFSSRTKPSPLAHHQPCGNSRSRAFSMQERAEGSPTQEVLKAMESQCPEGKGAGKAAALGLTESKQEPALPPLSAHEFKQYNRLAEHMNYFHEHFRQTWNMLYSTASTGRRPAGMSLKQFIDRGLEFIAHLTAHHNIEETYIFPILARKMEEFQSGGRGKRGAELLQQHKDIHRGMDLTEEYLRGCRNNEVDLEMPVLKAKMDTWGAVLWKHLDQEVEALGAENMRRFWTLDEVRRIPM